MLYPGARISNASRCAMPTMKPAVRQRYDTDLHNVQRKLIAPNPKRTSQQKTAGMRLHES